MLEWLGKWITSLTAASLLVSCASALAHGAAKRHVKFAGGLLLTALLLMPVRSVDIESLSRYSQQYRAEYEDYAARHITVDSPQIKLIIEGRAEAYILAWAETLGIECSVVVTAEAAEDGYPYPVSLEGTYDGRTDMAALDELRRIIEAELCIARENQIWSEG